MKNEGLLTHTVYPIELKSLTNPIKIVALGDFHWEAKGFALHTFDKFLDEVEALGEDTYYVLMGDSLDTMSASERKQLSIGMHDTTEYTLNNMVRASADRLIKKLDFMKGRVIGCLDGNHNYMLDIDGLDYTTEQYIAEQLGGNYLATLGFVVLQFKCNGAHFTKTMVVHHGKGGGSTIGGSMNPLDRLRAGFPADIYAMGHNHQLQAAKASRLISMRWGTTTNYKLQRPPGLS
jgi:predicted phosphodiesterase